MWCHFIVGVTNGSWRSMNVIVKYKKKKKESLLLPISLVGNHTDGFYVFVGRIRLSSEYAFIAHVDLIVYMGRLHCFSWQHQCPFGKTQLEFYSGMLWASVAHIRNHLEKNSGTYTTECCMTWSWLLPIVVSDHSWVAFPSAPQSNNTLLQRVMAAGGVENFKEVTDREKAYSGKIISEASSKTIWVG